MLLSLLSKMQVLVFFAPHKSTNHPLAAFFSSILRSSTMVNQGEFDEDFDTIVPVFCVAQIPGEVNLIYSLASSVWLC